MTSGVFASLIAGVILTALGWFFETTVRPAMRKFLWQGTDISGVWNFFDTAPSAGTASPPAGQATVRQWANDVEMVLRRHADRTGSVTAKSYRYTGRFAARQLALVWHSDDRPDAVLGAVVLHLDLKSRAFAGYSVFYDSDAASIVQKPIFLCRP